MGFLPRSALFFGNRVTKLDSIPKILFGHLERVWRSWTYLACGKSPRSKGFNTMTIHLKVLDQSRALEITQWFCMEKLWLMVKGRCTNEVLAFRVEYLKKRSTDIAKISRKRLKPDNHEHGNGIECAKSGECYQGEREVCFLCERVQKSILAIYLAWSPSPIIIALYSFSSLLDEYGFRGLTRWQLSHVMWGLAEKVIGLFVGAGIEVRILQKSQENGQNRTIMNTGTELSVQKPENAIKVNKSQPMVNSGHP
ncbi:hypothetical protein Tco_0140638 [Tanacetum coccineum]